MNQTILPATTLVERVSRQQKESHCTSGRGSSVLANRRLSDSWWIGLALVGVVFISVTLLTWRKWPDILIDFGTQLYLPWKISTGSVLYRDVMYLTGGPLSQYYNALLFRLFGVSLLTLVISNLIFTAVLLVLLYRRFLAASDSWTATTVCLGIILLFVFGQYGRVGNFNFITPYCHEVLHGLVISILAIVLLSNWITTERVPYAVGAGLCTGLVFLTKPEVFAALAICATASFILFRASRGWGRFFVWSISGFTLASVSPLIGFLLFFHRFEGWQQSLRSVLFAWIPLLESSVGKGFYYRWCMGLDTPAHHLCLMATHFLVVCSLVTVCAIVLRRKASVNRVLPVLAMAGMATLASGFAWIDCGRSLPLLDLTLCIFLCAKYGQISREKAMVFPLLWSIFALVLLGKLGFFSRIWHYGFALAMPAFASSVYLLLWLAPLELENYGIRRQALRCVVCSGLAVGFLVLASQSEVIYHYKTLAVGCGRDRILSPGPNQSPTGIAVRRALEWIQTNVPQDASLAVLPEGVMLNYLSRRTNPTRHFVWNPAELETFGEEKMEADFKENNPDFIVLVHRTNAEFGVGLFGQEKEFGLNLMNWIKQNYDPVYLIGEEPLQEPSSFGVKIMKKRAAKLERAPNTLSFAARSTEPS